MTNETTRVVFRIGKGNLRGLFALFPDDEEGPGLCGSYEHVGQHGSAAYSYCIQSSRPATPAEYAELKKELESEPYNYKLKVVKRR
jgi:hypothetical protein